MALWSVVFAAASVFADEVEKTPAAAWPMFRGNLKMTGAAADTLPAKLELLWKVETKEPFESTAAIADGVVYLPSLDGSCFAFALEDGRQIWKYVNKDKDGSKSSPCIAGRLIAYGDEAGGFRALDRKTGELAWDFKTGAEIISSPSHMDGKLLFGSYDESLYCLEAESGKQLWTVKTEGPVHCSPTLVGEEVVVAGCDGTLRFVSVKTGKQTRALELGGNIASTPALVGSDIYFGTMGSEVLCVDVVKLEKRWSYENPNRQMAFFSSPAVAGGLVLIGGRDKLLHAIDRETGKMKWTLQARKKIDGSAVVAGGMAFFGSTDGTLFAVDVATGKSAWTYLAGGDGFTASPAVAKGRLVIGDLNGNVYCFGSK